MQGAGEGNAVFMANMRYGNASGLRKRLRVLALKRVRSWYG